VLLCHVEKFAIPELCKPVWIWWDSRSR